MKPIILFLFCSDEIASGRRLAHKFMEFYYEKCQSIYITFRPLNKKIIYFEEHFRALLSALNRCEYSLTIITIKKNRKLPRHLLSTDLETVAC